MFCRYIGLILLMEIVHIIGFQTITINSEQIRRIHDTHWTDDHSSILVLPLDIFLQVNNNNNNNLIDQTKPIYIYIYIDI